MVEIDKFITKNKKMKKKTKKKKKEEKRSEDGRRLISFGASHSEHLEAKIRPIKTPGKNFPLSTEDGKLRANLACPLSRFEGGIVSYSSVDIER